MAGGGANVLVVNFQSAHSRCPTSSVAYFYYAKVVINSTFLSIDPRPKSNRYSLSRHRRFERYRTWQWQYMSAVIVCMVLIAFKTKYFHYSLEKWNKGKVLTVSE